MNSRQGVAVSVARYALAKSEKRWGSMLYASKAFLAA